MIIVVKSKAIISRGEDGMRKLIEKSRTSKPSGIEVAGGRDIK